MTRRFVLMGVVIAGLILAGCWGGAVETGRLEGTVTIGPIHPVEKEGEEQKIPCAVYEARKVMVYDRNGDRLVKQVDIDCQGHYQVDLPPATYTIDINRIGIDHSGEVPARIEIRSGETVKLDIDIDTGIR